MFRIFTVILFIFSITEIYCYLFLLNKFIEKASNVCLKHEPVFPEIPPAPVNKGPVPELFDWRDQKMVSPVKNQMTCAACWAFTVVGNIESHLKIYLNQEVVLSEQFLLDCNENNMGCESGSLLKAYTNIVANLGGVLRDQDYYPYANRRLSCRWEKANIKVLSKSPASESAINKETLEEPYLYESAVSQPALVPVIGFRRVISDEEVMAEFVYKYGPLSAAINSASMAKYKGDIDEPTEEDCDPDLLDHSVLIVGYNVYVSEETGERVPYWIIKNSWGTEWGDNGYYYLIRGRNACGIAKDVSFALVN